ncbi:DUF6603 domain-containing protein [Dactylosporangium sp. CS-033363]|uniref:DUF6603 domain-containing protein n=1 Tax=Dactylosporangium sp. CS-033363 TaxID=3239935 RepID=UPI003D901E3F
MAADEVSIARLGAWLARALGATAGLATDLDTDALGYQLPDEVATDPAVLAAATALGDSGDRLLATAEALDTATGPALADSGARLIGAATDRDASTETAFSDSGDRPRATATARDAATGTAQGDSGDRPRATATARDAATGTAQGDSGDRPRATATATDRDAATGTAQGDSGDRPRAAAAGDDGELGQALLELLDGVYRHADALTRLAAAIDDAAAALPAGERDPVRTFAAALARRAFDSAVVALLEREWPRLAYLLRLLGLLDWRIVEASGRPGETRYAHKELRLDRAGALFTDPAAHLADAHGWGTARFDPYELMRAVLPFFGSDAAVTVDRDHGDATLAAGPSRWRRDRSEHPPGLILDYAADVAQRFQERVETSSTWGIGFDATLKLGGGAVFRLRPPTSLTVEANTGPAGGRFAFTADRNQSARGFTIVGGNDLLALTADNAGAGADLTVGADATGPVAVEPALTADLTGLTLTLGTEDADGFVASLLAGADLQGRFDLHLAYTLSKGLTVTAAGGLATAIPMHQSVLDTLYLILTIGDEGALTLEASAGLTATVGPLTVTVDRIGATLTVDFTEFPPVPRLAFKPPQGAGLAIDTGLVTGGGYLALNTGTGEYSGAVELVFAEFLALKAIGIAATRLPDGTDGFSLLVVITAEFGTPLQLGLGFVLTGVGGLLGLHRTMRLDELADGVRTGELDGVMFPRDVVADAPRIIADLGRWFPAQDGTFVVGPMARLGWGTPPLITATLGVVLGIPPGDVAILGVLRCTLPDEAAPLLDLQVQFVGALELERERLWFSASLFGSRVAGLTVGGDLGLLISWGGAPSFVLSVGGFHPRFAPPPLPFPVPRRVALSILDEDSARIRIDGYLAVTANTAQFGAGAEVFFGLDDFSIDGHLGFDALFQFNPFLFSIAYSASMGVKVFGAGLFSVRIRGALDGPSPWHVEGAGSITLLLWDLVVPFAYTWGERTDTVRPDVAALPILAAELAKAENWIARPPSGSRLSVTLRAVEPTADLVLHPLGTLQISQRAVPLDLSIQTIGSQRIADLDRAALRVATTGLRQQEAVRESFATAQFRDLDPAARLSAPGYEPQDAGVVVAVTGPAARTSHAVKRVVLPELIVIDSAFTRTLRRYYNVGRTWFQTLLGSNAAARSPLSQTVRRQRVPFTDSVTVAAPGYVIADRRDNTPRTGAAVFTSHARAADALAAEPGAAQRFHVIPAAEAA